MLDIVGSDGRRFFFDVAGRQSAAIAGSECESAFFAMTRDQFFAQIVLPITHDRGESRVEVGGIELDPFVLARAHQHMQLRERRIADLDGRVDAIGVQCLFEHRFDAQPDFGVVTIARDVGQYRIEAAVTIVTHEQAAAHALLQTENAAGKAIQFLLVGLEQFVARQGFENMPQRLAAVAVRLQAGFRHHVIVTFAHQRNLPRPAGVSAGGVQTNEALFADCAAVGIETQHADIVHVTRAMHRGARIGLGENQRVDRTGLRHEVRGQGGELARFVGFSAAQQTKPGLGIGNECFFAALLFDAILAVAQEREMIVSGPAQELLRFFASCFVHRHPTLTEVLGDVQHLDVHGRPVRYARRHVRQDAANRTLDRSAAGSGLPVDLKMHHRFIRALAHRF